MALSKVVNNSIESVDASKLTGAMPALDGSNLTGIDALPAAGSSGNVLTSDGTDWSSQAPTGDITKSASNPAVDTNPSGGVGTMWLNTTTGEMYSLTDATTNTNIWTNVGDGTGVEGYHPTSAATGGTITTDGDFKVHSFTSSGTFTVTDNTGTFDLLLIAGGGAAGAGNVTTGTSAERAGGGGAGGYRYYAGISSLSNQAYTITIGGGGTISGLYNSYNGQDSSALGYTASGGGFGGYSAVDGDYEGQAGGSGGGAGGATNGTVHLGGLGNAGGYSPVEGYNGGTTGIAAGNSGGGGGSAGPGSNYVTTGGGGPGTASTITGASVTRASGGDVGGTVANGAVNTGDGGVGGQDTTSRGTGGSGIVIIRYRFQ
jgi:hypothetical protein